MISMLGKWFMVKCLPPQHEDLDLPPELPHPPKLGIMICTCKFRNWGGRDRKIPEAYSPADLAVWRVPCSVRDPVLN